MRQYSMAAPLTGLGVLQPVRLRTGGRYGVAVQALRQIAGLRFGPGLLRQSLHDQTLLPAIAELPAIRQGDGVARRAELAGERKHVARPGALKPTMHRRGP